MSILDKVIAVVAPPEGEDKRAQAREAARSVATPGDWLSAILDHHQQIEQAFVDVRAASDAAGRRTAQSRLAILLNGHAMAEEAVIYPALAHIGKTQSAETAYGHQVAAKLQIADLDHLDPMSEDYLEKLCHLESAIERHVFEEEHDWFVELKDKAPPADQARLTRRYLEEYERYMRGGAEPAEANR